MKGTFVIEVFLWLVFLPIGIIYSLWRLTGRKNNCLACLIHQSWDSREKDGKRGSMGGGLVLGGSYVGEDGFEDVSRGRI